MKYATKLAALAASTVLLSSCGSNDGGDLSGPATASTPHTTGKVSDYPPRLGKPYQVGETTYTPEDVVAYDDTGYASFYGQELAGRPTANGEIFNPRGISGAHKTLPLPSYVEVTALDTGRTILVRINDRGPFANDRLVDLSEGAARQLGITGQGLTGVRVRKVNPPEQERAVLRGGLNAQERFATPESLLKVLRDKLAKLPKPANYSRNAARPVPGAPTAATAPVGTRDGRFIREGGSTATPPAAAQRQPAAPAVSRNGRFIREGAGATPSQSRVAAAGYVVQMASFSSRSRADALARKLGAKVMQSADGRLFRVRYGPYGTEAEAQQGLATARQRGYPQARLFRE